MSLSLLAARSITDRRHIDPNPDRLPAFVQRPVSASLPASSLLLLSTSAEAAVQESRKFERANRPGSIQAPRPPPPRKPSQQQQRVHHRLVDAVAGVGTGSSPVGPIKREPKNAHTFKCEKCPKVYRHPQCLVKHRWEHTSYWADASKLMLSKHQQVQMLEAAAILATPSGSLPESRSLWPAAVSPSEAGLLGSDQVNLDVIQSQSRSHRSSSSPCSSLLLGSTPTGGMRKMEGDEVDMNVDEETGDEAESSDEIMFEMSINGDDSQSASSITHDPAFKLCPTNSGPLTFSISAPPPMGYFQPRNTSNVTTLEHKPEPFIAYSSRRTSSISSVGRVFNPPPYADSGLRFQGGVSRLEEKGTVQRQDEDEEDDEEDEEDDEDDDDEGFGIRDVGINGISDEVVGMEL